MNKTVSAVLCMALLWLSPGRATDNPGVGYFPDDPMAGAIVRVNSSTCDGMLIVDSEAGRRIVLQRGNPQ